MLAPSGAAAAKWAADADADAGGDGDDAEGDDDSFWLWLWLVRSRLDDFGWLVFAALVWFEQLG